MNGRIAIYAILMLATAACIIEQKSQGKYASAFSRSLRIAARNSDAYIDNVIKATNSAIKSSNAGKLKALFSGQDSSTAVKAYHDFIDDKLQSTISIGKMLDTLLDRNKAKLSDGLTTLENRYLMGFAKFLDETSAALDVHMHLINGKNADLKKLIEVDIDTKRLESIANEWQSTSSKIMRQNARRIKYLTYQERAIKQLQTIKSWQIDADYRNRLLSTLTPTQRQIIDKEKIWSRDNLYQSIIKRLQIIRNMMNNPAKSITSPYSLNPNYDVQAFKSDTQTLLQVEANLRSEIEQLLDIDDKFLQQLE